MEAKETDADDVVETGAGDIRSWRRRLALK